MHLFALWANGESGKNETDRGLPCINHEAITPIVLQVDGVTSERSGAPQRRGVADEMLREFYVRGVSSRSRFGVAGNGRPVSNTFRPGPSNARSRGRRRNAAML